jgi:RNA polymerase sigma-70 factor (ECF subfamily)
MSQIRRSAHLQGMNGQAVSGQISAATVRLARTGDEAAFACLVAAYHADMARVAYVTSVDRTLAEDAVQAAWLIAWQRLRSLRDVDRVRAWLLAVTANEARQLARRRRPVVELDLDLPDDPRDDPSLRVERLDLRNALIRLSPDDRTVLAMHFGADLSAEELGAAIGASPEAARKRLWRAVARLRKELDHA